MEEGQCPLCGVLMFGRRMKLRPTRDHFLPRVFQAKGGYGSNVNIWFICFRCNNEKGAKLPDARQTVLYNIQKGFCGTGGTS